MIFNSLEMLLSAQIFSLSIFIFELCIDHIYRCRNLEVKLREPSRSGRILALKSLDLRKAGRRTR